MLLFVRARRVPGSASRRSLASIPRRVPAVEAVYATGRDQVLLLARVASLGEGFSVVRTALPATRFTDVQLALPLAEGIHAGAPAPHTAQDVGAGAAPAADVTLSPLVSVTAGLRSVRLSTTPQGDAAVDDLDARRWVEAAPVLAATAVCVRSFPPGPHSEHLVADGRLLMLILTGAVEFLVPDGVARCVDAGDLVLVEDTWGTGHAMRVVSAEPAVVALVQLAD